MQPTRRSSLLVVAVGALLVTGCGSAKTTSSSTASTATSPTQSSTTTASSESVAIARLTPTQARRAARICARAQTSEDTNVIVEFANRGASIFSPNVLAAMKTASSALQVEAEHLNRTVADATGHALAGDSQAEGTLLASTARLQGGASRDQASLKVLLRRRSQDARAAGVPSCGGAPAGALTRAS